MPAPALAVRRPNRQPIAAYTLAALLCLSFLLIALGMRQVGRIEGVRSATPRLAADKALPYVLLPPVEPATYADMTGDQARLSNAAVPFVSGPIEAAKPFLFVGSRGERENALTCLAIAVLDEAGDDKAGEQAVAQVVLNRLRHPAFPKTVCGVIFQGSDRKTGCQFTFTCDGALDRVPSPPAWKRARAIADAALSGYVDKTVGLATHYHTDWVVPYWRGSLDKIAQVHTQVFYRWHGWWGTRAAFTGHEQAVEQLDPRLVALAGPEALLPGGPAGAGPVPAAMLAAEQAGPPRQSLAIEGVPASALRGSIVRVKDETAHQYALQLDPSVFPGSWAVTAFSICGGKPDCMVFGWTSEQEVPRALPVMPLPMRSLAFLYRKSSALGAAEIEWDCRRFARSDPAQCLPWTRPTTARAAIAARPTPRPDMPASVAVRGELSGVRMAPASSAAPLPDKPAPLAHDTALTVPVTPAGETPAAE